MITIDKVKKGITEFADTEICSGMSGVAKFVVATSVGVITAKLDGIIQNVPAWVGLVQDGKIDIETLYRSAKNAMDAPIPVTIPMIGTLTFTSDNLDTLYSMITKN